MSSNTILYRFPEFDTLSTGEYSFMTGLLAHSQALNGWQGIYGRQRQCDSRGIWALGYKVSGCETGFGTDSSGQLEIAQYAFASRWASFHARRHGQSIDLSLISIDANRYWQAKRLSPSYCSLVIQKPRVSQKTTQKGVLLCPNLSLRRLRSGDLYDYFWLHLSNDFLFLNVEMLPECYPSGKRIRQW